MLKMIFDYYWKVGFKTRLYDALAPEAYLDSLEQSAKSISNVSGVLLDVGCGSGLGFQFQKNCIANHGTYIGLDILLEGLAQVKQKAMREGFSSTTFAVQSDLAGALPLRPETVDAIIAHFSVYTLESRAQRVNAWKQMISVMKPGGRLSASNPSINFDPTKIINDSLELLRGKKGRYPFLHRYLLYPLTRAVGLKHIAKQLKRGAWKAYSKEEFVDEVTEAGFYVERVESVYAGSGYLLIASKK